MYPQGFMMEEQSQGILTYSAMFTMLGKMKQTPDSLFIHHDEGVTELILAARVPDGDIVPLEECELIQDGVELKTIIQVSSEEA